MSPFIYYRIAGYITTAVLHTVNAVTMIASFHGDVMKNPYVKHFSEMQVFFFTCWTFFFQTVYSIYGLYCDLKVLRRSKEDYKLPQTLIEFRDIFFTAVVWPSSVLTFTIFWPFFFYDRQLFYPEDIDLAISKTSNHIMHSFVLLPSVWELIFYPRSPPRRHWMRILIVLGIEAMYIVVLLSVKMISNLWVYPIFEKLYKSIYFPLFFVFIAVMLLIIYYEQWTINNMIRGHGPNVKKSH